MKMLETFLWRNPSIFGVRHTHCFQSICPSFAHLAFIELKASRLNKWGSEKDFCQMSNLNFDKFCFECFISSKVPNRTNFDIKRILEILATIILRLENL